MNWARNRIGSNFSKNIVIKQQKTVEIGMPWHEADRTYHQFFQLINPQTARIAGNEIGRSGLEGDGVVTGNEVNGKLNVPSGYVLAVVGTYPVRLELYTSDDALKPISSPNILDEFEVEELIILLTTKGLKSAYRPKYPDKYYLKLIAGGYLATNRSITIKGRNVVEMSEIKNEIEKRAEKIGMEYSKYSHKLEKKR